MTKGMIHEIPAANQLPVGHRAGGVILTGDPAAILCDAWRVLQKIREREAAAIQPAQEGQNGRARA